MQSNRAFTPGALVRFRSFKRCRPAEYSRGPLAVRDLQPYSGYWRFDAVQPEGNFLRAAIGSCDGGGTRTLS